MGKRPSPVVDLTGTDSDECVGGTKPLRPVQLKLEIPWISKLPKQDPSNKTKVARVLSEREIIKLSQLRKDAAWFEEAERLFKAALPV